MTYKKTRIREKMSSTVDVSGFGPLSNILRKLDGTATQADLVGKINEIIDLAKDTNVTDADFPTELRTLLTNMTALPDPNA